MRRLSWLSLLALIVVVTNPTQSGPQARPGPVSIAALQPDALREWDAFVDRLAREGTLRLRAAYDDPARPGRRYEAFVQQHAGLEVYGGDISRTTDAGATVSVFGIFHHGVDVDPTPQLDPSAAARAIEQAAGSPLVSTDEPTLVILPLLDGRYVLAYRATARNAVTYFVDAHTGDPVMQMDERHFQSAVGTGRGVLGDLKKVSATSRAGVFAALDGLRPARIGTLDTGDRSADFDRLQRGGPARDSDFAVDTDNDWTHGAVVDTHAHIGWTYDYFFKRHQHRGWDDRDGALYGVVASGALLPNNAFFISPPFGPDGAGGMFFGHTTRGTPVTVLDVVAHEFMHGVTFFALRRRTGSGLGSSFVLERGPSGCGDPFWCDAGRFLLTSNHAGAINEALSDIFGTAVEFSFHPPGTGPLRADYLTGEDLPDPGFQRSLADPASLEALPGTGIRYPDHVARRLGFPIVFVPNGPLICGGLRCDLYPAFFIGDRFVREIRYLPGQGLAQVDNGGVHWNLTILGHVFYLAVEGGQNRTSGRSVQGVGAANRAQIERVFFGAVRDLLPRGSALRDVAAALRQSAAVLYGAGSAPFRAVDEALAAVGL
jgi:Zn-dependent metalloprotease